MLSRTKGTDPPQPLTEQRRIFTERFDDGALAPWARRTARLDLVVHHLGLALGGRPAASFARRLMLPVSNDTLLRVVRRRGCPPFAAPSMIGLDDWAWRRNQRYGTIICDVERRRPITLLPDREPATAQAWLAGQPQIAVVARPRWRLRPLLRPRHSRRSARSPTVGTSWRTPARPSSMRFANLCARSASRSAPPP
jgi:transposase